MVFGSREALRKGVAVMGEVNVSLSWLCTEHWTYALSSPTEWGTLIFVHCVGEELQFRICVHMLLCMSLCVCVVLFIFSYVKHYNNEHLCGWWVGFSVTVTWTLMTLIMT